MVKCLVDSTGWVIRPPRKKEVSSKAVMSLGRVPGFAGLEGMVGHWIAGSVGVVGVSCGDDPMMLLSRKSPVEGVVRS